MSNDALKTSVATVAATTSTNTNGQGGSGDEGPASIRYKGISFTPGGFIAAETVTRTRATSADINTPFTGIPFEAADLAHTTETNFTARQSRLSLLAESKFGSVTTSGYYEADFLGAGTTSNNRQSNSYVFRQRQVWAQAAFDNGFIITGGQQWTLATETKKGVFNRQEDLPMVIDPQYVVGFTWARQYGARFVKDFGGKFALGFSVEGPQATIGGRGFSSVTTINSAAAPATIVTSGATTATSGNFFINAPGAGGGLYNAFDATGYTVNKAPDLIFKAAADRLRSLRTVRNRQLLPRPHLSLRRGRHDAKAIPCPATPTVLTGACAICDTDDSQQLRRHQQQHHRRWHRRQRSVVPLPQEGGLRRQSASPATVSADMAAHSSRMPRLVPTARSRSSAPLTAWQDSNGTPLPSSTSTPIGAWNTLGAQATPATRPSRSPRRPRFLQQALRPAA